MTIKYLHLTMFKGLVFLVFGVPFIIYVGILAYLFTSSNKQDKDNPNSIAIRPIISAIMLSPIVYFMVYSLFNPHINTLAHTEPTAYPIDLPSCDITGYDTAQYHGMTVTVTQANRFYLSKSVTFIEDTAGTYKMLFADKVNSYILITFNNGSKLVSRANYGSWFFDYPKPKGNNTPVKKVAFAHY